MQQFDSFAQMQRDAAMRVMEMQRRAQAAMRNSAPPPDLPVAADISDNEPLMEPEEEEIQPAAEATEPETADISQEESERALVTAILLLLMRENADERLIFALLYILL